MIRSGRFDALLFDIDDVLVDVSKSYLEGIARTVPLYLEQILEVRPSGSLNLLDSRDVLQLKLLGGFNNDWDAVYGFLLYFQSLKEKMRKEWNDLDIKELRRRKNLKSLSRQVPSSAGPTGLKRFVKDKTLISYELAKDIFQEIYLGPKLFERFYGRKPFFYHQPGLIEKERLLIPKRVLQTLRKRGFSLGIVTGRIRFEAEYVLRRFNIRNSFQVVVTHDDIECEEVRKSKLRRQPVLLRKPHPFGLLLAARKLGIRKRFLYIGDLPDDMTAARRAKKVIHIASCGFLAGGTRAREKWLKLKKAGADFLIKSAAQLLAVVRS